MQGAPIVLNEVDDLMDLPPGFRFHPTDEEIITHYLTRKVMDSSFNALAVAEVDMNKCEPWDLPKRSKMGEKENYFFCQRDRKYPTGMRTNRATGSGYWKATGKDKEIYKKKNCMVGMKKTLVFYKGRAPKGEKTNWVMHEYRLEGRYSYYNFPKGAKDEWVVCRVFHKSVGVRRSPLRDLSRVDSFLDHLLHDDTSPSLPPLMDIPSSSTEGPHDIANFSSYFSANNIPKLERQQRPDDDDDERNSFFINPTYNYAFKNHHHHHQGASSSDPNSAFNGPPISSIPGTNTGPLHGDYRSQSYSFSGFKATPDHHHQQQANCNTINSAAIQGKINNNIQDSERRCCKAEPYFSSSNNNSMVSPSGDTGISNINDLAPEISSIEDNNNKSSYHHHHEDLESISVDPSMSDLDSLWEYY